MNVCHIMFRHGRRLKCPLLNKFLRLSVVHSVSSFSSFSSTENIFQEYCAVVALWTDDDSVCRQTAYLLKERSFQRVSNDMCAYFSVIIICFYYYSFLCNQRWNFIFISIILYYIFMVKYTNVHAQVKYKH